MKRVFAALLCAGVSMLGATAARAEGAYPNKLVKIIVPFGPGGSTDLLARSLGERLGEAWKQPVIVENRNGWGGITGSDVVAKSKPDGYTLLLGTATTHAVSPSLYPKIPYNAERDFIPISELVAIPQLLSVHPSRPIHSVKDLVAYAKSKPGEVTYAGGGPGTTTSMSMAMLTSRAGIKLQEIAYKGSGQAMIALMGGEIDTMFDVLMTSYPNMKSGRIRSLAITSAKRHPLVPQIPTVAESGFPGFESSVWFGLFAPAGTPPEVIKAISEETRRILADKAYREKLETAGFEIVGSAPAEFKTRLRSETEKWRKVIVDADIKVEQ